MPAALHLGAAVREYAAAPERRLIIRTRPAEAPDIERMRLRASDGRELLLNAPSSQDTSVAIAYSENERFEYQYLGARRAYRPSNANVEQGGVLSVDAPADAKLSNPYSIGASLAIGPQFFFFEDVKKSKETRLGAEGTLFFAFRKNVPGSAFFNEVDPQLRLGIRYGRLPFCNEFSNKVQSESDFCRFKTGDDDAWKSVPVWHFPIEAESWRFSSTTTSCWKARSAGPARLPS